MLLLSGFLGVVACDDTKDTPLKEVPPPAEQANWVTAAEGGSVALEDGARVDVPAGALTTDATVILERVTCDGYLRHPDFSGCLYAVRAEGGAALEGRYTLTLPGGGATQKESSPLACLLGRDTEGWRCQGDSAYSVGGLTASASRFNSFVGRVPAPSGLAPNLGTDYPFVSCGGDLTGDWETVMAFGTIESLAGVSWSGGEDFSDCGPFGFNQFHTLDFTERFTVNPRVDEQVQEVHYSAFRQHVIYEFTYLTESCMSLHGWSCSPPCRLESGICGCAIEKSMGEEGGGGSLYVQPDGSLTFDPESAPLEYCVMGDLMALKETNMLGTRLKVYRRRL